VGIRAAGGMGMLIVSRFHFNLRRDKAARHKSKLKRLTVPLTTEHWTTEPVDHWTKGPMDGSIDGMARCCCSRPSLPDVRSSSRTCRWSSFKNF